MNVWALIGQSYALPFRAWRILTVVFWPAWLALILAWALLEYPRAPWNTPNEDRVLFVFASLAILLSQTLALASCLVRWHRHLIRGEGAQPGWLLPWGREWWFFLRWFWLGLIFYLFCLPPFPDWLAQWLLEATNSEYALLVANQWFGLSVGTLLVAICLPLIPLSLAGIAVGDNRLFPNLRAPFNRWSMGLAIVLTVLPFVLAQTAIDFLVEASGIGISNPENGLGYYANSFMHWVLSELGIIVFATMLSFAYREHVVPPAQ